MRIAIISLFIMVVEMQPRSQSEDNSQLKLVLEGQAEYSGGKTILLHLPIFPQYDDPVPVLNDSVFATVEEYPEGYTGILCAVIGNLRYTLEHCSQHVWECSDGKLFKKTCAGPSIFWFSKGICDSTVSQESACKRKKKNVLGVLWPLKYVHVAEVKNVTELSSLEPGSAPVLITADCRNYSRAEFAIKKCHPEFVLCRGGYMEVIRCSPSDLVYDERSHMCGTKESCSAPVPYTQHSLPLSHFIERFDGTPKHAKVMKTMRYPGPINLTMDCKLKRDGEFEQDKCHPNYVYCFSGKRKLLTCIDGQVFKYGKGCVKMEECEKLWEEEATSTPAPIIEEEEQPLPSFVTSEQKTLVPNVKDCRDKINGVYAMKPCQAWYILCYRENGYMMRCSKGFVMSRRYMMCVGEEFCDE